MIMILFMDGHNSLAYPVEASERDTEHLIQAIENCERLSPGETASRISQAFAICESLKTHPVQHATPMPAELGTQTEPATTSAPTVQAEPDLAPDAPTSPAGQAPDPADPIAPQAAPQG